MVPKDVALAVDEAHSYLANGGAVEGAERRRSRLLKSFYDGRQKV